MNEMDEMELREFDQLEESGEETTETFVVDDLEKANWAFRKLRAYQRRINEKKKLAEEEISRVEAWLKSEIESDKGSVEYFENLLIRYYQNERLADSKFKLSTPYGKVTSRKRQPKISYDDDKTVEYLEKFASDQLEMVPKYNKREIRKLFDIVEVEGEKVAVDEMGQKLDFIKIEDQNDSYTVKID